MILTLSTIILLHFMNHVNCRYSNSIQPVIYGGLRLTVNQQGEFDFMKPEVVEITSQSDAVQGHAEKTLDDRENAQKSFFHTIQIPDSLLKFLLDRFVSISYVLRRLRTVKPRHLCGGILINSNWVLTAAHCISPFKNGIKHLQVSKLNYYYHHHDNSSSVYFKPGGNTKSIETLIMHSNFTQGQSLSPDIALIQLKHSSLIESSADEMYNLMDIRSQFLMDEKLFIDNLKYTCLVAGVGHLKYRSQQHSNSENYLHVAFVHLESCHKLWNKIEVGKEKRNSEVWRYGIEEEHSSESGIKGESTEDYMNSYLCAGGRYADGDTCQGDSGGPLLCIDTNSYAEHEKNWFLTGIASSGIQCGLNGVPSIYTAIHAYREWIDSIIG